MRKPSNLLNLNPDNTSSLRRASAAQNVKLIEQRRTFHALPELGWQEVQTTAAIVSDLTEAGYEVVSGPEFLGHVVRLGMSDNPIPSEGDTGCMALFEVLSQIFLTIEGGRCADAIMPRAPQTAGMR
jgi:aminobenzoyl-glutamate utilization protein A